MWTKLFRTWWILYVNLRSTKNYFLVIWLDLLDWFQFAPWGAKGRDHWWFTPIIFILIYEIIVEFFFLINILFGQNRSTELINNVLFSFITEHYKTLKYKRNQITINVDALYHQIYSNSLYLRILQEFRLKFRYILDLSRDYFVKRTYLICSLGFNSVLLDNWRTIILRHTLLVYVQSQNAKSWKSTNYHVVFSQGWLSIINQRFPHSYPPLRKKK